MRTPFEDLKTIFRLRNMAGEEIHVIEERANWPRELEIRRELEAIGEKRALDGWYITSESMREGRWPSTFKAERP